MDPMDTPPYEPIDAEPTARAVPHDEPAPRANAPRTSGDRTKKVVAIAAVASFFTAMIGMAAARSGDGGSARTTTTPASSSGTSASDDGADSSPFDFRDDNGVQPGAAQPGSPTSGRGDTSSHGS